MLGIVGHIGLDQDAFSGTVPIIVWLCGEIRRFNTAKDAKLQFVSIQRDDLRSSRGFDLGQNESPKGASEFHQVGGLEKPDSRG